VTTSQMDAFSQPLGLSPSICALRNLFCGSARLSSPICEEDLNVLNVPPKRLDGHLLAEWRGLRIAIVGGTAVPYRLPPLHSPLSENLSFHRPGLGSHGKIDSLEEPPTPSRVSLQFRKVPCVPRTRSSEVLRSGSFSEESITTGAATTMRISQFRLTRLFQ
jgi:hypothetical protein